MFGLAFLFYLSASVSASQTPQPQPGYLEVTRWRAPLRCDDGSSPFQSDGSPNWDCEIHECSPHEDLCWSERLDHCYDDNGDDNGVCGGEEVTTCKSKWSCFKLWVGCNGPYQCNSGVWYGCDDGQCTERNRKSESARPRRLAPRSASLSPVRTTGKVGS